MESSGPEELARKGCKAESRIMLQGFAGGEALGVRNFACAFFECSIYPLNSDPTRHKGRSKLPHSKAPSARDANNNRH